MKYIEKSLAVTLVITFLLQLVPITVFAATVTSTDSKEEDTIVEEIENLREPDKKYFKMSDGSTLVAMYNTNIHNYYDGKYKDINNNLIGITDLYNNNLKIKFANKSNNKLVSIKFGSDKVSWYLENSNKVKVERQNEDIEDNIDNKLKLKNTSSVIYRDILKNIDIEYVNISNTLKENIIIKDKEYSKIVFVFDTKLNMKVNSDNSVSIGEYLIDAPYMYDANMNYSENVKLNLTKEKNYYKLEIIPDEKFMENSVYPVTIDPSINTSQHYSLIKDTFVYPADASSNVSNRGNQASLVIGSSNESMVGKTYGRGLIKFTLPSLKTGDQIIDASLYLTSTPMHWYGTYPTSQIEFDVHKMNVNWDTYTAYYSNTNNYDNKVTDYIVYEYSTSNPMKTYEFNITEIVKDWYVTGKNYGVMIKEKMKLLI